MRNAGVKDGELDRRQEKTKTVQRGEVTYSKGTRIGLSTLNYNKQRKNAFKILRQNYLTLEFYTQPNFHIHEGSISDGQVQKTYLLLLFSQEII